MTEDEDRILRASVPEKWKHCASPIGSVQSYIAELEEMLKEAEIYLGGFMGTISAYKKVEALRERINSL